MLKKEKSWHCRLKLTDTIPRSLRHHHQRIEENQKQQQQQQQTEYQPKTLRFDNQQRRLFLPTFPNCLDQSIDQTPLLLANVSANQLSSIELSRRSFNMYPHPLNTELKDKIPSYICDLFERLFNPLIRRLHINPSIADFNLYRLQQMIDVFISHYRSYHRSICLYDHNFQLNQQEQYLRMLNTNELFILLEFFLQIDVDLFYMKTCTFRTNETSPVHNRLFCTDEIIDSWYDMIPCQRLYCTFCQVKTDQTIQYSTTGQKHHFVNGYEAILNGAANCQTTNMIYVLTCLCGDYDYISSTHLTLDDALKYHRQHLNRILIEYLLNGQPYPLLCKCIANYEDKQRANRMRLYQHFCHCPIALQYFLKSNPSYWCFIPMENHEAQFDDLSYAAAAAAATIAATVTATAKIQTMNERIDQYLINIPKPPMGYTFSQRQQNEQRQFFQTLIDQDFPLYSSTSDLYHATIVALLPNPCSQMLRQMIEILFVTHAESKLNSFNLLTSDTNQFYGVPYHKNKIWCENLIHPTYQ